MEGEDRSLALALGASPLARQLRRIHLRGIPLGDDGASEILRSDRLMQLEHLALIDAEIGPAGVRALSKAKLRPLASLDLSGNPLTADAIERSEERRVGKGRRAGERRE